MTLPGPWGPRHFSDYGLLARLNLILDEVRSQGATKLPPETELCRRLDVDRSSLHRILQTLGREGVLHQVRNKGWFFPPDKVEIPVARYHSYTQAMAEQKKQPRTEILGVDQQTDSSSSFFPASCRLWVFDLRRYDGALAISLARSRVPVDLTPGLNVHLTAHRSLYQALAEHHGIRPLRLRTWCEAVAADLQVSEALGVAVGSPLLKITHHAEWNSQPFEHTVNLLRADACRVRVDLVPVQEETP